MRYITTILVVSLLFASARAQTPAAEQIISADRFFAIKLSWFDGAKCPERDKTRFYFKIGKQAFMSSVSEFVGGRLRYIRNSTSSPDGSMKVTVSRTAGCKSDPLPLLSAGLKTGVSTPDIVEFTEIPERPEPESPVARYIKHLGQTRACKTTRFPNLVACSGSRTEGDKKIDIVFFVVTDLNNKVSVPASGIPIHARCEGDTQLAVCYVSDEIENGTSVKSFIDIKKMAAPGEEIRRVRQSILDFAAKHRAH